MSTQIVEYSATEAALADLAQRYKGVVFDVSVPEQLQTAKVARNDIRGYRTALEKKRVELKADVLERGRLIDGEAKRITAALYALEDPIEDQIKAEERRKEGERLAAEKAEADRIIAEDAARKKAEEDRMAAERAEIARRQAELDKAERESRRKIEEQEREARVRQEVLDREARTKREAAEAATKAEAERVAVARREVEERERAARLADEERQRKEREAQEAIAREALRKKNESLDGWAILSNFVKRYAKVEEFDDVVADLNKHLRKVKK